MWMRKMKESKKKKTIRNLIGRTTAAALAAVLFMGTAGCVNQYPDKDSSKTASVDGQRISDGGLHGEEKGRGKSQDRRDQRSHLRHHGKAGS